MTLTSKASGARRDGAAAAHHVELDVLRVAEWWGAGEEELVGVVAARPREGHDAPDLAVAPATVLRA